MYILHINDNFIYFQKRFVLVQNKKQTPIYKIFLNLNHQVHIPEDIISINPQE